MCDMQSTLTEVGSQNTQFGVKKWQFWPVFGGNSTRRNAKIDVSSLKTSRVEFVNFTSEVGKPSLSSQFLRHDFVKTTQFCIQNQGSKKIAKPHNK